MRIQEYLSLQILKAYSQHHSRPTNERDVFVIRLNIVEALEAKGYFVNTSDYLIINDIIKKYYET